MTMTELREAFADWPPPKGEIDAAFQILRLLKDPTPITEAGLLELGFRQYFNSCVWWMGELRFTYKDDALNFERREIKTIGQLRGLLLFVEET